MIRFIATDLDGTLLNDSKLFNTELFDIIERLNKTGIIFAPASSRPIISLTRVFYPVKDKICLIANNGARVFKDGKEIIKSPMDRSLYEEIIKLCKRKDTTQIMVDGEEYSYSDRKSLCDIMNSPLFHYNAKYTENLLGIPEEIYKISIFDGTDRDGKIRGEIYELLKGSCDMSVSGQCCLDFVEKNISKGSAVKKICEMYNISLNETMVFGDNYNDAKMLESAGYSYAMKNADFGVKKIARFVTKEDNNNDGVIRTIKEICFGVDV